jgi:hypothetical protein
VLHERYATPGGYSGESLNIYDASRKLWHQTWVDSTGTLLLLDGGVRDGRMMLEGQTLWHVQRALSGSSSPTASVSRAANNVEKEQHR